MRTGTFAERVAGLRQRGHFGTGLLSGSVEMNQVYAHYQHERLDLHHPRGGGPKYLERPLFEHFPAYYAQIAREVLTDGGEHAMWRSMEHLSDSAELAAPWEWGDLMHSGHPQVTRGMRDVYDRPPKRHRLTEAELRAKSRLRWPSLPARLKGWIYWHNTIRGRMGLPPPRRGRP